MPKRSLSGSRNPGNEQKKIEQLNKAVEAMLARADGKPPKVESGIEPLVRIAAELRNLPSASFKARLKSELGGKKKMSTVAEPVAKPSAKPVAAARITASPRLAFLDPAKAIEFYQRTLGAKETFRFQVGDSIPHAELMIGDSAIDITGEWPEGGRFSAETLGGSPISISIQVPDVDAFTERAVAAGMKLVREPKDQFYGHRDAMLADPFGYSWAVFTVVQEMSVEEMHRRMQGMTQGPEGGTTGEKKKGVSPVPAGYHTVTPYLVVPDVDAVINLAKQAFGGEETFRVVGAAGGYHCEVRVEDSILMIGGGGTGVAWKGEPMLGAFHVYVRDCDAAYKRAIAAGAKSLTEPADQFYGERSAHVIDAAGNYWYIATCKSSGYKSEGAPAIQPYLHPLRVEPVMNFLKRAFGAEDLGRFTSPDGVVHHMTIAIGDSHLEMGEAQGPYQPMKSMFYLYVQDVDSVYKRALAAGAKRMQEPADQPYGDRVGAVSDVFGNQWWIATRVKDVAH
jgi:PhnB protein